MITLFAYTASAVIAFLVIYKVRDLVLRFMSKAFQGESYQYREQLLDFSNKIQNVFSLKEQGGELLGLLIRALGCKKAGLLFLDVNGDYDAQLIESFNKEEANGDIDRLGF